MSELMLIWLIFLRLFDIGYVTNHSLLDGVTIAWGDNIVHLIRRRSTAHLNEYYNIAHSLFIIGNKQIK